MDLKKYSTQSSFYDELLTPKNRARPGFTELANFLKNSPLKDLKERQHNAELAIRTMGITFTVYSEGENIDREWPFDIIPRMIRQKEWEHVEKGLTQRLQALNLFITDIYNDEKILKDKRVPRDLLRSSKDYRKECEGVKPLYNTWAHVCGTDLVRGGDGTMYVLEDNLRVPSGVSYMMENRNISKQVLPELFEQYDILPMDDYPTNLFDTLSSISPRPLDYPEVVVLTPGT
ncbi:MAG: putative circularly permuted ATP-grasp superfamily protein, partial [Candidatus Azotimanducaceae bacterium]